jgi:hypothetical protein
MRSKAALPFTAGGSRIVLDSSLEHTQVHKFSGDEMCWTCDRFHVVREREKYRVTSDFSPFGITDWIGIPLN